MWCVRETFQGLHIIKVRRSLQLFFIEDYHQGQSLGRHSSSFRIYSSLFYSQTLSMVRLFLLLPCFPWASRANWDNFPLLTHFPSLHHFGFEGSSLDTGIL
ncbi:hypothetical protein Avbf_13350, partial [Armadillidium vulgare]